MCIYICIYLFIYVDYIHILLEGQAVKPSCAIASLALYHDMLSRIYIYTYMHIYIYTYIHIYIYTYIHIYIYTYTYIYIYIYIYRYNLISYNALSILHIHKYVHLYSQIVPGMRVAGLRLLESF